MGKQFTDVNTFRGAPMGRHEHGHPGDCAKKSIRLFAVRLDRGGYDDGGAYWGHGGTLYCATDGGDYRRFARAKSRAHAALLLNIEPEYLRIPLARISWGRYSAVKGWFGGEQPGYEIQEFGRILKHVDCWDALCWFAQSTGEK